MKIYPSMCCVVAKVETVYLRTSFVKVLDMYKDKEIVAAEVGVYEGINSKFMLCTHSNLKLFLVDAWTNVTIYTGGPVQNVEFSNMIKTTAEFNVREFPGNCCLTHKNSEDAVKDFNDNFFDYVYIDGDHECEAVKRDLSLWWPKVKEGGVFGGHDYGMVEVSTAVNEFIANLKTDRWGVDKSLAGRSDWWIFK